MPCIVPRVGKLYSVVVVLQLPSFSAVFYGYDFTATVFSVATQYYVYVMVTSLNVFCGLNYSAQNINFFPSNRVFQYAF